MQKFINDPSKVVDEMLEAYIKVHSDLVSPTENERVIKYKNAPVTGKVGIVTGGGSGHKPAFVGYVGRNLVDAVAVGEIFSSPPAQMFYDAIKEADGGEGVAVLYGNYAGDNMNVAMAMEEAEEEGEVHGHEDAVVDDEEWKHEELADQLQLGRRAQPRGAGLIRRVGGGRQGAFEQARRPRMAFGQFAAGLLELLPIH